MADYAKTLPEWDKKNIFSVGRSQGGGFALLLGALCPGVTGVVADVPSLCDLNGEKAGHAAGGPGGLLRRHPGFAKDANYYDAANFAVHIKCPVIISAGFADDNCPPASIYSAYNRLKCEKAIYTDPLTGHGTGRKRRWFQMMPMKTFIKDLLRRNGTK